MSIAPLLRRSLLAASAVAGLYGGVLPAQLPDFSGRPIVELIEALREQGRRIIYSGDVLPARLRVDATPAAADPLDGLRQVLAPHGLDVEIGPRDTWLIVRSPQPQGASPTVSARPGPLIPPSLETVIVTASRYPIERRAAGSTNAFSRHTLETTPALGEDPLRVTHRLPGVTSDQLTSKMHIRGGTFDEVLLTLDGIRLYSPYHLKDFQNVFSSINARIVESMDVRTGGYEARFGDHMSGVIEMQSIDPTDYRRHELGLSLLETSVLSSGLFANGRGAWVTSLRRGNLDVLSNAGDSEIGTPQYVDFFNKVEFSLTSGLRIETGALSLDDKITLRDGNVGSAAADYDDSYLWLALEQSSPSGFEANYRLSTASLTRSRTGSINDPERVTGELSEKGKFDRLTLAADWSVQPTASMILSFGAEAASMDLDHRFESALMNRQAFAAPSLSGQNAPPDSILVNLGQSKRSAYVSLRYQPLRRLVTELGVRRDDQSVTGEHQVNPRIGLLFDISDRTSVRTAWGEYSQSDSLSELAIADGLSSLQPAEKSRHFIVGLEHEFGDTGLFRVEIYEKRADHLARRFENVVERVSLLPELLPDRFALDPSRVETRGVEISIEGQGRLIAWWANIALARTQEHIADSIFLRSWDERRSFKAGGEWSGQRWTVTANLGQRSGWPISNLRLDNGEVVADMFNAVRLPDFASVDVRASRTAATARGRIEWFFEVSNLLDHSNNCCLDYRIISSGGADTLEIEYDELLGIVPNVGISWEL